MKDRLGRTPEGGIHIWGNTFLAIVFSKEQAEQMFMNIPPHILVLCLDVPRAEICLSLVDAIMFYEGPR